MDEKPYQAPQFDDLPNLNSVVADSFGPSPASEAEIRAFVGKNADYYLGKWQPALDGFGRARGFNWAAFLFIGFWLPYRKMYRFAFILFGVIMADAIIEQILIYRGIANEQALKGITRTLELGFSIVCGSYGNAWYYAYAMREISRIRAKGLDDSEYFHALSRRGGTNPLAGLGMLVGFIVILVLILAVLEALFVAE
jgi:hypothetical protein